MPLTIQLTPETEARLKARAAREGRSEAEIVSEAIEKLFGTTNAPMNASPRLSVRGIAAGSKLTVDEFLREKHAEKAREEVKIGE